MPIEWSDRRPASREEHISIVRPNATCKRKIGERLNSRLLVVVALASCLVTTLVHCLDGNNNNNINLDSWLQPASVRSSEQQNAPVDTKAGLWGEWPPLDIMRRLEAATEAQSESSDRGDEIFLLEDKDYPRSLFEDYSKQVGQVSGIATLPSDDVVIFHRAERQWNSATQMPRLNSSAASSAASLAAELDKLQEQLIKSDTLMVLDGDNGNQVSSFGANLFYMPHSVASDPRGNLWVSDTGRHQVMRLPVGTPLTRISSDGNAPQKARLWPDIVLGEAFTPGQGVAHFCEPAELAVSSDGRLVFIADGYCNQRVVVYTSGGRFVKSFGQQYQMRVVHSLSLLEERNLVCVADRENARILCFHAGLDGDLAQLGELRHALDYPIGRVYALASISRDHLLVSSSQPGTNRYDLAILNPFTHELKLVWTSSDLLEPHSLARTFDRQYAYAADVSQDAFKKVFKFNVITKR